MEKIRETKKYYLYLTAFITGAVILLLEILGTRILAPYYGTTIYVWSSLIGVTLIALTIGYLVGGWLADRMPRFSVLYVIILVAALFLIIIPLIKNFVLVHTNALGPRYGALVSAAVLFALPLILLGTVVPYAIRLKTDKVRTVGITAGSLYGVATIGSFVGALATGFYLIPLVRINAMLYGASGILALVSLVSFIMQDKKALFASCLIIFILLTAAAVTFTRPPQPRPSMKVLYEKESPYAHLRVIDFANYPDNERYLLLNGAPQSRYLPEKQEFDFPYLALFEKAVGAHTNPSQVLIIGSAAGSISKRLQKYDVHIDNVEIDPTIVEIARRYFDFNETVIVDDGRHYVRSANKTYDLILVDAFTGYSIYPYLFSREAFTQLRHALNEKGILVLNTIYYPPSEQPDPLLPSIYKTLQGVFPHVAARSLGRTGLSNIVFYASDSPVQIEDDESFSLILQPDESVPVITDEYNPLEHLTVKAQEEFRKGVVWRFGNLN